MKGAAPDFRLLDTTLRDGSHAVSHRFALASVEAVVAGLDAAGVPVIEVTHGDGLGGSSFNYGFSAVDELLLIERAVKTATDSRIACLLIPGIGVADDLRAVHDLGVEVARVAVHCTEADITAQHLRMAKDLGMEAIGFLMMSHMSEPAALLEQARLLESYGADWVYIADSAGAMTTSDVRARISTLVAGLGVPVGMHAHQNLSLAVANSIAAYEEGASGIDGTLAGLGAGTGNCPIEILAAVCDRSGIETGVDTFGLIDLAQDVVRPLMDRELVVDRDGLLLGYAGVYSSFLLHAQRAADRYGVPTQDVLVELGRRKVVGGQEDMIIDVAIELAARART